MARSADAIYGPRLWPVAGCGPTSRPRAGGAEGPVRGCDLRPAAACGGLWPDQPAGPRQRPSRFASSPESINVCTFSKPPISTPLTKIIGNVGQPLQIFSAVRRRHVFR
jgi:hypothetical protein